MSQNLTISLGLPEFRILKQHTEKDLVIVKVEKISSTERCPFCGYLTSSKHDQRIRLVRDLPVLDKNLFLKVHTHRYRCTQCNEVFSQTFESIKPNHHQTLRFREFVYAECFESTIQHVSKKLKIPYTTVERIYYTIAAEKLEKQQNQRFQAMSEEEVTVIGIDEIAVRKGHNFETVFIDLIHGGVVGMTHGRNSKNVKELLKHHSILSHAKIQTFVLDMWDPYHKAVQTLYPTAKIVIDKYHVIQKSNRALDQIRKGMQGEKNRKKHLKKGRFLFLKGMEKLDKKQREKVDEFFNESPALAEAYYLKELLRQVYQCSDQQKAKTEINHWLNAAEQSSFPAFKELAKTIRNWFQEIMNYFEFGYTNGRTEGTNHKIKNIKRRAYGYRNLERFRMRVMLECVGNTRDLPFIEWLEIHAC